MTAKFSFNNPPLENIAFLMAKKPEIHFDYDEIKFEAHQRAFTIAKITQIDLLSDIQTSLENAFVEGQSYQSWVKELKPTLQKHGWFGKSVEVINPKTNKKKSIEVGATRLKKIFYTNTRTAYAQSRARAQEQSSDEYLRYVAILDSRTRHTHAQMHGLILKKKDPFWEKNYPPNGWNCRCRVDSYSKDDLDEFGWRESSPTQKLNIAEKDWDYDTRNLEKNDNALQLIIENKLKRLAKNQSAVNALNALKAEIKAKRQRYEAIRELWNKQNANPNDFVKVGEVGEFFKNTLKQKGKDFKGNDLILTYETIEKHRKDEIQSGHTHKEIGAYEYSLTPYLLDELAILGIFQDKNLGQKNKDLYITATKLGAMYRFTLKQEGASAKILSLMNNSQTGENYLEKLIKNKNKVAIYLNSEGEKLKSELQNESVP